MQLLTLARSKQQLPVTCQASLFQGRESSRSRQCFSICQSSLRPETQHNNVKRDSGAVQPRPLQQAGEWWDGAHAGISRHLRIWSLFINVVELCSKWPSPILWAQAKGTLTELSGLIPVDTNPNQNLLRNVPRLRRTLLFECYMDRELFKGWTLYLSYLNNLYQLGWTKWHGTCPTKLNGILDTMSSFWKGHCAHSICIESFMCSVS